MVKTVISPADMKKAEGYALLNCQNGTIAGLMGWEHNFIEDRPDIRKKLTKKRQEHKLNIRKAQEKQLNTPVMAIWLGKNALGQTDKLKTEHDVSPELKSVLDTINGSTKGKLPGGDSQDSSSG